MVKMLTALFATAAISTTALGEDPTRNPEESTMKGAQAKFESLDRNNDRQLSRSEAAEDGAISAQFASVDANGDGSIDESEYVAHAETMLDEPPTADPFDPRNPIE